MSDHITDPPVYEVSNMTEYIGCVKRYDLENSISRGEDKAYPSLEAAAFRRNSSLDIREMVGAFEQRIGNTLTEMQRKHFLAFSQHYGLPTNLLDFTFSPLISLYFACGGEPETAGYVYFIKKDRLINISKQLDLINSVFLSSFLCAAAELDGLFDGITRVFARSETYVFEFLEQIDEMLGTKPGNEAVHAELLRILQNRGSYSIDSLDRLIAAMKKRLRPTRSELEMPLKDLGSYGCLFVQLLRILVFRERHDGPFCTPFYFTYEPANITNRISNQSSVFIYQLYGIGELRQKICPDAVIRISSKAEMLEDLDCMGINEQFIFNDYDHIAAYIKKKHLKLSDEREQTLESLKRLSRACLREEPPDNDCMLKE